jgi:diguanylate cyclase (GGDEF)-like protein
MSTEDTRVREPAPQGGEGEAALVVLQAPSRRLLGARLALRAPELVLGRDDGCDVALEADDVSRRHARVRRVPEGHRLDDLGSTNGTFVEGERTGSRLLAPGDLIHLGSVVLKYVAGDDAEASCHAELRRLATEDALTGLANRGVFADALAREVKRARRHGRPLALALVDVDRFKQVNDRFGHPAGDAVLRALAGAVRPLVRAEQLLARVGGEELALLLPDVTLDGARAFAEKIRHLVAERPVAHGGAAISVTVSIGVAALAPDDGGPERLFARADERLYEAKRAGRDRVVG